MKLFNFDRKHQNINGELDLGNLSENEVQLIEKVIGFLDAQGMTNRYKELVIADGFARTYEEGEPYVEFLHHD